MTRLPHISKPAHVLCLLAVLALLPCVTGCALFGGEELTYGPDPYFDQGGFYEDNGRYAYDDGQSVAQRTGVDVSEYQGAIDWDVVKADGIDFAFIRIGYRGNTEGGVYADRFFEQNYHDAHEAGLACGVYFFSQATSVEEARQEASFALGLLAGRRLEYPIAFDYEILPGTRVADVDAQTASQIGEAFCSAIRFAGYEPMIYGNTYELAQLEDSWAKDCAIWCAEYDEAPSYNRKFEVWQYTEQGRVAGIVTPVDLNLDLAERTTW